MNLREYQAKRIFAEKGLAIPPGKVTRNSSEVEAVARELGGPVVLKPQMGFKKRGKLGLIKFADNPTDARSQSETLFRQEVKCEKIETLLVEKKLEIAREFYLAVTIDYSLRQPVLILSKQGGVDIEELAKTSPDQLLKIPVHPLTGLNADTFQKIDSFLDPQFSHITKILYTIFSEYDAEVVEINPLIQTKQGEYIAVDGVLNINDDSLFRHPEIASLKNEWRAADPIADEASANSWTYIDLPGDIAILSSGAGLTMTILDLIHFAGGSAANFLDTAQIDEEGIFKAFELLTKAKQARALLINIFAGLNRCDSLAHGIQSFLSKHRIEMPIVVRMVGNKETEGHEILRNAGIEPFTGLEDAVERVVHLAKSGTA